LCVGLLDVRHHKMIFMNVIRRFKMAIGISCIIASILICQRGFAQPGNDNQLIKTLHVRLPQIIDSAAIPAISIAVIRRGKIVWSDAMGLKNKETKQQTNKHSIFEAASLGKPVFAYAVLKLCDVKKLHLDTPLVRYLPKKILEQQYLKAPLMDERLNNITARMVLSHTSGLPNWRNQKDSLRLLFAPGERYSYSGEGFAFLQTVVEYLTALPVNQWMEQTVFLPLKMNRSSFIYQNKDSADYVTSYENDGKPSINGKDTEANVAHTFRTTAEDYARFLIGFISGSGLKNETRKLLFTKQVETGLCKTGTIFWGLGIALQPTTRGIAFLQWAKSPSASGYVFGIPEEGSAVVYFTNVANQGLRIGEAIVELTEHYRDPLFSCFGVKQYNQ